MLWQRFLRRSLKSFDERIFEDFLKIIFDIVFSDNNFWQGFIFRKCLCVKNHGAWFKKNSSQERISLWIWRWETTLLVRKWERWFAFVKFCCAKKFICVCKCRLDWETEECLNWVNVDRNQRRFGTINLTLTKMSCLSHSLLLLWSGLAMNVHMHESSKGKTHV